MPRNILVRLAAAILLVTLLTASAPLGGGALPSVWLAKIDPSLLAQVSGDTPLEFLVSLDSRADLRPASALTSKAARGRFVFEQLTAHAARTQAPLLAELNRLGLEYRSYWVANVVWVRGSQSDLLRLAARPEVFRLSANPPIHLILPAPDPRPSFAPSLQEPAELPWNLTMLNVDDVWALGFTGQNIVIGGQDTGYEWDHPALKSHYRGWDGFSADHNYNWHDAIHSATDDCTDLEPCDDLGHGTHTMGILVGDDGAGTQTGVAPGAKWIGCRNMIKGAGTPATYIECYQWFVAPTDLSGQNPDPSRAPHIINNSWSCPEGEDCVQPDVLLEAVQNVRAAGILTVHSAGNSGPSCSTINSPAAIYAESFTVGNLTSAGVIAFSSSRGPVDVDLSVRLKPDLTAPGSGILSSYRHGTYQRLTGTSMAAPHVAGVAALLLSARPDLVGQVSMLESILRLSSAPLTTDQACGDIPGSNVPNNTYGWGRVDALAALEFPTPILDLRYYVPIYLTP